MEQEHKGWRIEVHSYRSTDDRWRPDIHVLRDDGGRITDKHLLAPADRLFETEHEADEWGMTHATAWVDLNG